jgi:spermidine synthase
MAEVLRSRVPPAIHPARVLRDARLALLFICFASGAAALIYQAVWFRWFRILLGNTAYAASATLCAFFAGLALGAEIFGRVAARSRRPLVGYGVLEMLAAAAALLVPFVFVLYDPLYGALYDALSDRRGLFILIKFGLALAVMVPPAFFLGGTLPLLAAAYVRDPRSLGREAGLLYAVNTLGAAAGSAAGLLWLPEVLGVRGTYGLAAGLAVAAGIGALALARRFTPSFAPPSPDRDHSSAPRPILVIAFISGFGILALEVLLIRCIAQVIDHSVYSYGVVLVVVLLALAAGAAIASATAARVSTRALLTAALTAEALLLLLLPFAGEHATRLGLTEVGTISRGLALAFALGGAPLLAGALVFPLCFRLAAGGSVGRRVGGLLAVNTVGGILGSVAASFLLLDRVGLWGSVAALGLGYGLASLLVPGTLGGRALRAGFLAIVVLAVMAGPANPLRLQVVSLRLGERLVASSEGAHGIVAVVDAPGTRRMTIDNHYTLSGSGPLNVRTERFGHLPLLLHPDPERVLFVGSATGHTAGAAVLHPLEEIVLVEIVPEVQELAAHHFASTNRGVHSDPRTRLVVEDGRNHVRATRERYDVIVADLFAPWRPGVGSLYSREHFEAVKSHLGPDGVFCQWLPLYQLGPSEFSIVASTFLDVFPTATLWRADFFTRSPAAALVGFAGDPPTAGTVQARIRELERRGVRDRWLMETAGFWMLYMGPLEAARSELGDVRRNTDDSPLFEFRAGRSTASERKTFVARDWPSFGEALRRGKSAERDPFGQRGWDGARAGAALARAHALALQGKHVRAQRELADLRASVPAELLDRPDPSVGEAWNLLLTGRR